MWQLNDVTPKRDKSVGWEDYQSEYSELYPNFLYEGVLYVWHDNYSAINVYTGKQKIFVHNESVIPVEIISADFETRIGGI